MKESGGIATTIALLIAAILGVSYIPRKAADSTSAQGPQRPAAKLPASAGKSQQQAAAKEKAIASCEQIAKRLTRLYPANEKVAMPGSCYPDRAPDAKTTPAKVNPTLTFAIAIVPNPVQTHLPLTFDRAIESIQQAAQDNNYAYDGSWFPWNHSEKAYESLSDEEQAARLETELQEQPGIMVFRRGLSSQTVAGILKDCTQAGDGGAIDPHCRSLGDTDLYSPYSRDLVIFVVAEQPTGGISDVQFEQSLQWMQLIQPDHTQQPLLILGPTFSGTLPSLARELTADTLKPYVKGARIYSGTTNSETSVHWFQLYLAKVQGQLQMGGWQGELQYRPFFEGDALMTDRFLCYLQHEGYDLNRVAILSEDETAFGKSGTSDKTTRAGSPMRCQDGDVGQPEPSPIYLYYPRDIASLRSAYEQQSIFAAGKQPASGPSTSLRGDLSESASSEHDTVRTYGGQLTPLAQEATLFGIANILDSKHVEFILLRSSNSLDQLFLSEFLRRSYPNGRVVIDGADLLFRRGIQGASLRGVMLLSPYPLLSWTQDAIPAIHGQHSSSYRVFAQDSSEGIYIAARELLDPNPGEGNRAGISDYAPPRSAQSGSGKLAADRRPATWVSVVGHRQFWPIAVLNEQTEVDSNADPAHQQFGPSGPSLLQAEDPQPENLGAPPRSMGLPGEMASLLAFCVVLSGWHWYCCAKGSIFRPPRVRAYFAPIPKLQHASLIFVGSLLLGLLGVTLLFAAILGSAMLAPVWTAGIAFAVAAIIVFGFLGCLQNFRLPVVSGEIKKSVLERIQRWRQIYVWSWIPALAALAWLRYLYLTQHLTLANKFPTFWRSVFLRSGVSPLLPQVLLIVGLYAWFWFNLHGLALFGEDRPVLPRVDDLPQIEVAANHGEEARAQHTRGVKMFRMFSQEGAGQNIEANGLPLGPRYLRSLLVMLPLAVLVLWVALRGDSLRSLGDHSFGTLIFYGIAICTGLILADTLQLLNTWSQLRQLLMYLDRLRLRRTFGSLKGLFGGSVWKLSGNVLEERYRLISRQFESARHLQNALAEWITKTPVETQCKQIAVDQLAQCETQGRKFATWYVDLLDDEIRAPKKAHNIIALADFQRMLAATAGCVMKQVIMPEWQTEKESLIRCLDADGKSSRETSTCLPPHVSAAEEFFVLPYLGFIQNTLGRVRTIAFSIVSLFVAATMGVSCYPFDPLPVIGAIFLILFAVTGATMIFAYAEMCRDTTLSHIANTNPGELGTEFWVKLATFGLGPLLGLLTTLFPSMTDFVVSFLQPGAQAFK